MFGKFLVLPSRARTMQELPSCLHYMFRQGLLLCVAISLLIFFLEILFSEQKPTTF